MRLRALYGLVAGPGAAHRINATRPHQASRAAQRTRRRWKRELITAEPAEELSASAEAPAACAPARSGCGAATPSLGDGQRQALSFCTATAAWPPCSKHQHPMLWCFFFFARIRSFVLVFETSCSALHICSLCIYFFQRRLTAKGHQCCIYIKKVRCPSRPWM